MHTRSAIDPAWNFQKILKIERLTLDLPGRSENGRNRSSHTVIGDEGVAFVRVHDNKKNYHCPEDDEKRILGR